MRVRSTSGFPGGVVVDLEDHVGLAGQALADPVGQMVGLVAGGPEAQVLVHRNARARRTRCTPGPVRPRPSPARRRSYQ